MKAQNGRGEKIESVVNIFGNRREVKKEEKSENEGEKNDNREREGGKE